jgi:hypothetical protein
MKGTGTGTICGAEAAGGEDGAAGAGGLNAGAASIFSPEHERVHTNNNINEILTGVFCCCGSRILCVKSRACRFLAVAFCRRAALDFYVTQRAINVF